MTIQAQVRFFGIDRSGQSVHVYLHGTTTHATIFDTDGVTTIPNPVRVTTQGFVNFAADPDTYDCVSATDGATVVVELTTPPAPSGGTGGPETDPIASPAVVTERNRAQAAEGTKADASALTSETSRATAAEQAASTAASNEATRAQAAESAESTARSGHAASTTAHPASSVTVNPSGLVVVTTSDVQAALAQLDAEFVARKRLPAAPTDGQLAAWDAASGQWQAVNPSGASLLAYAENNTGTTQAGLTNVTVDVTGCTFIVPASTRPVLLSAYIGGFATVAPTNASLIALITEVSNGVDTPVTIRAASPPISAINKVVNAIVPMTQLAANTARTRTFKLQALVPTSGTWTIENGANNDRSVLAAWAG